MIFSLKRVDFVANVFLNEILDQLQCVLQSTVASQMSKCRFAQNVGYMHFQHLLP